MDPNRDGPLTVRFLQQSVAFAPTPVGSRDVRPSGSKDEDCGITPHPASAIFVKFLSFSGTPASLLARCIPAISSPSWSFPWTGMRRQRWRAGHPLLYRYGASPAHAPSPTAKTRSSLL